MFPPESGSEAQGARVRTVGRHARPFSLVVALGLLTAFWTGAASMAVWGMTHRHGAAGRTGDVAGVVLWSLVFALLAWRVWRGGRTAIMIMGRLGTFIGVVFLAGMVAYTVLFLADPASGSVTGFLPYLLPGLASSTALLTAGVLLRRREVSRWSGIRPRTP
jgi:hypothetical protein